MREAVSFLTSGVLHVLVIALLSIVSLVLPHALQKPSGQSPVKLQASMPASARAVRDPVAEITAELTIDLSSRNTSTPRSTMLADVVELASLPVAPDGQIVLSDLPRETRRDLATSGPWDPQIAGATAPRRLPRPAEYKVVVELFERNTASDTATSDNGDVEQMPRPVANNPAPPYPTDALAARQQGRVWLAVFVGANGSVVNVRVSKTSGTPALDNAALATMYQWRFTPARRGGEQVAFEVLVPVRFEIVAGQQEIAR